MREASYSKGAKQWVIYQLEQDNDPHDIAFEWWLPRPECEPENPELDEVGFEEAFASKEELLEDVDWNVVSTVVRYALKDCYDKSRVNQIRQAFQELDNS